MNEETFYYAGLNEDNICTSLSAITEEVINDNLIRVTEYDLSYVGRRYNRDTKEWN